MLSGSVQRIVYVHMSVDWGLQWQLVFFIQSWNVVVSPVDGSGGCCSFCLLVAWKSMDR